MRRALLSAAAVFGLIACGGDDRPSLAGWEIEWRAIEAQVPTEVAALDQAACEQLLGDLRTTREEVVPTPVEALDAAVTEWIDVAEALAFDCEQHPDPAAAVEELRVLAAEIDAGVEAVRTP